MVVRIYVDSTSIRRSQVDDEIKSKFLDFRPTPYFLKSALKGAFPRELSFFLHCKKIENVLCHFDKFVETWSNFLEGLRRFRPRFRPPL